MMSNISPPVRFGLITWFKPLRGANCLSMKKKKDSKVVHVLNEDCRTCVRDSMAKSPFMQDLYNAKTIKLVSIKGSIPYLKAMTKVIAEGVLSIATNDDEKTIFSDYITDIITMLDMFENMRKDV